MTALRNSQKKLQGESIPQLTENYHQSKNKNKAQKIPHFPPNELLPWVPMTTATLMGYSSPTSPSKAKDRAVGSEVIEYANHFRHSCSFPHRCGQRSPFFSCLLSLWILYEGQSMWFPLASAITPTPARRRDTVSSRQQIMSNYH